jgi:hypothetical protein
VEVVDLHHPGEGGQRAADLVGVDARRSRLHEHAPGCLQQRVGRVQQDAGDEQGGDGVGSIEPGGQDDHGGHRGGDEAVQVGDDVAVGALQVEAAAVARAAGEDGRRGQIDGDAHHGHDQDGQAGHRWRRDEPAQRVDDDDGRQDEQRDAVGLRREDLGAPQPVGHRAAGRTVREPRGHQRHRQRRGVGQHVRGV